MKAISLRLFTAVAGTAAALSFVPAGVASAAPAATGSAVVPAAPGAAPAAGLFRDGRPAPSRKAAKPSGAATSLVAEDGACDLYSDGTGEMCLWFLANFSNSMDDLYFNDGNLSDNFFRTPGAGLGQSVINNAESDWNRDTIFTAQVWTGLNFTGTSGVVPPTGFGNFNSTFVNNVESLQFI